MAIIGGGIVGWTSASNIDKNPLTTPHIFRVISPMLFIAVGFLVPAVVGYKLVGIVGILVSLGVTWLSSVVIGSKIHGKK